MRSWIALSCLVAVTGSAAGLEISVLSGRADMVTGGNALIEISGANPDSLEASVNGRDITDAFRQSAAPGPVIGLLEGLEPGANTLVATDGDRSSRVTLLNHPRTGPVISGPHQTPFLCQTERAGLGPPVDFDCSVETRVEYYYRSTEAAGARAPRNTRSRIPEGYRLLDADSPLPSDVATTTSGGVEYPFVVRVETGTINRAIYQIAFLHDPSRPAPDPWQRVGPWNGRLVYRFGGGCRAGYRQGSTRSVLQDDASLRNGYAVAGSSLNVFGNNCNDVLSAETMMMVKEHFIESFGVPVHTIGVGGSGGSMQQHLIAQNYPGLLDGIIPGASYPDPVTLAPPVTDCSLLAAAFNASAHDWSPEQKKAVAGFATWRTCESWMRTYSPAMIQPGSCAPPIAESLSYHRQSRPDGYRCDFYDNMVNLIGRDSATGLALRGLDNVGVEYGLNAFNDGLISAEQFLDLNGRIGGYDADGRIVPERSVASKEALTTLYRTGRVNQGGGSLGSIPIIDTRRYQDPSGNIHDRVRTFVMEARLRRANGGSANRIALTGPPGSLDLVRLMDRWLDAVQADDSEGDAAQRIARNRPAELGNACWSAEGRRLTDDLAPRSDRGCGHLFPASGDPRLAAGAPPLNDVLKCQLKPVDPTHYSQPLSPDQLDRLRAIFPGGVCDYSKPGVGQVPLEGNWLSY